MNKNPLLILAIGAIASIMIGGMTYDSVIAATKNMAVRTECKYILHHNTAAGRQVNPPFQTCTGNT